MLGTGTFVEVKLKSGEHTITVLVDDGTAMGRTALITAVKDDHQHIARARDREQAAVHLGMLLGYEIDE